MSAYELRILTSNRIEVVERDWQSMMDADVFDAEFQSVFEAARRAANGQVEVGAGNAAEYSELVDLKTGTTVGLIDIIRTRLSRQRKVLHFHFGPHLWDYQAGAGDPEVLADAYIAAVGNLLTRPDANAMLEGVKVYGRSPELLDILTTIASRWPTTENDWRAEMQGRFLLFRPVTP
ncbi:hypothetical protein [Micrococcus luteus]|uniref:hypothetical protein n=1 Tax=Micrococcus luteus TaxID=1270 RepID=UPI000C7B1599|nr:hypothetical protein [Micrococcus luteus]PLA45524.1 hypothetical protein CYJ93_10645 [Micrococcus luteus]